MYKNNAGKKDNQKLRCSEDVGAFVPLLRLLRFPITPSVRERRLAAVLRVRRLLEPQRRVRLHRPLGLRGLPRPPRRPLLVLQANLEFSQHATYLYTTIS